MNLGILGVGGLLDLEHLLLDLKHTFLILGELDSTVFARGLVLSNGVVVLALLLAQVA